MRKSLGIFAVLYCLSFTLQAQEKAPQEKVERPNIKFGKITPADFTINSPLMDSNANAVVISDIGSSEFEGNNKGWFSIVFKRHRRIKIVNKNGFDAATVSIFLYQDNEDVEKLDDLKATTYNLENGAVVATKLEKKDILEDKPQKRYVQKKFTFPALKEGSIIEYTYTLKSDLLFNLRPWEFQGQYSCLWSEYEVAIPEFFNYVLLSQGYQPFTEKKNETHRNNFTVRVSDIGSATQSISVPGEVNYSKWAIRNVPALKEESFTSTLDNHISKIEFQLSAIRLPNQAPREVMASWPKVAERMLQSESFGTAFTRANTWMNDEMKPILAGANTPEEKTRKIYEYIRDHFTCTSYYGTQLSESNSLKDVFKKKSGRVSDINLLLLAMLRHENIQSEPVLASLRSRGVVHQIYPLMDRFNYLVCQVTLPSGDLYLDASRPMLGFGRLPASVYNGTAWVLTPMPYDVQFSTDSLKETKRTSLILINEPGGMDGAVNAVLGNEESQSLREKMVKTKPEEYMKEIEKGIGMEVAVSNLQLDSLKLYDEPVGVHYDVKFKFNDEDVIYFNPMIGEAMKKNPFVSAVRLYPVEMPFTFDETFILDMEVPKGYVVDEVPKSVRYKFNDTEGMFEYIFSKSPEKVQMRCRMWINKTIFSGDDYDALREFFAFAIKKQGEQVVFKKQK